jgi:hypothetical protein
VSPESPRATKGRFDRSIPVIMSKNSLVPTFSACFAICSMSQGPWITSA